VTNGPPILILGATGFVGQALVRRLSSQGYPVRAMVRSPGKAAALRSVGVDCVMGDVWTGEGLDPALQGVSTAYYLVHAMGAAPGGKDFAEVDRQSATNFAKAASRSGLHQVVYLGGLGDDAPTLSRHLASRREVGQLLRSGSAHVTQLRAGIVIGAGGASFEMMVQLVEKLPVMICPRWIDTRCQAIALEDLVSYLVGCAGNARVLDQTYDVGGPDVLRYSEMLMRIGAEVGRRPTLIVIPRFTPALSSHWVGYITEVSPDLARPVIDGMASEAVCREDRIRTIFPLPLQGFDESIRRALQERRRAMPGYRLTGGRLPAPFTGRILRLTRRSLEMPAGP